MKNSFVLYTDYLEQMEYLNMEERGILFTAIMQYVNRDELPEMDSVTGMAFSFIKAQIDRDAEKYNEVCEKRRAAGKLGGRPQKANGLSEKQKNQMVISESKKKQTKAKKPDNEDEDDNEYEDDDEDVYDDEDDISNPSSPSYIDSKAPLGLSMYSAKKESG